MGKIKSALTPKSGIIPLAVEFTDKSEGNPTEWYWDFGDEESSTQQDPTHTYQEAGSYTVILTATNDAGNDTVTRSNYIRASTTETSYKDVSRSGLATNTEQIAGGDKEGAKDLKITDKNLKALQNQGTWEAYGSGELLVFGSSKDFDAPYQETLNVTITKGERKGEEINATSTADYVGTKSLWGECVSFAKTLSKSTKSANKEWIRGLNVVDSKNVKPGTVIATFVEVKNETTGEISYKYKGHTAIFRDYIKNSEGNIIGIKVWDQNYTARHAVGRHNITSGSKKQHNAINYYVVQTLKSTNDAGSDEKKKTDSTHTDSTMPVSAKASPRQSIVRDHYFVKVSGDNSIQVNGENQAETAKYLITREKVGNDWIDVNAKAAAKDVVTLAWENKMTERRSLGDVQEEINTHATMYMMGERAHSLPVDIGVNERDGLWRLDGSWKFMKGVTKKGGEFIINSLTTQPVY